MTPHDDPSDAPAHEEPSAEPPPSPESPAEARARRRAELPAPGTVEHEAALLVDLLSQRGWGTSSGMPSGSAPGGPSAGPQDDPPGESAGPVPEGSHECTCGGRTPAACKVCPVCQLIAFVQQVSPETIDKVAEVVAFAATALRDLATAQRERQARAGNDEHPGAGGADGGSST